MKGGRTAPRDEAQGSLFALAATASMKGGRTAPRDNTGLLPMLEKEPASMKGGRTAPRDSSIRNEVIRQQQLQ